MAEWTPEATDYLEGYLRQVAALARSRGDDAEEITSGLRDHIIHETEAVTGAVATLEHVQQAIAQAGAPEQVIGEDWSARATESRRTTPPLPQPAAAPARRPSRWPWLVPLWVVVMVPFCIFLLFLGSCAVAIFLPAISRSREAARRAHCQEQLQVLGQIFAAYAHEHDGAYPPVSSARGRWMVAGDTTALKGRADLLQCPSDDVSRKALESRQTQVTGPTVEGVPVAQSGAVDDYSYFYLGFAVTSSEDAVALVQAIEEARRNGEDLSEVQGIASPDGRTFERLDRDLNMAASEVPVLVERPENHVPAGGNVLFMDGHVEFIRMGEQHFPLTQELIDTLESMDASDLLAVEAPER